MSGLNKETLTVDYSVFMGYMKMMLDFDNNGDQYAEVTEKEIKEKLEKATGKKVRWKNKKK